MSNNMFATVSLAAIAILLGASGVHAQLTLTDSGDANCASCIGIGTTSPGTLQDGTAATVHIQRDDGDASLFIEEQSNTTADRDLLELRNNGSPRIVMKDTDADAFWRFSVENSANQFVITRSGTGAPEMKVENDGDLYIRGNLSVAGATLSYPLVVGTDNTNGNGAHVTAGGSWTNGSSREFKEDITSLDADDAFSALDGLTPVRFRYTLEPDEEYVGFIAEDVPDLVATSSHKHLSPMDIVAVLTKVVQEQQSTIEELSKRVSELEGK